MDTCGSLVPMLVLFASLARQRRVLKASFCWQTVGKWSVLHVPFLGKSLGLFGAGGTFRNAKRINGRQGKSANVRVHRVLGCPWFPLCTFRSSSHLKRAVGLNQLNCFFLGIGYEEFETHTYLQNSLGCEMVCKWHLVLLCWWTVSFLCEPKLSFHGKQTFSEVSKPCGRVVLVFP